MGSSGSDSRIYVGNLPNDMKSSDLQSFFERYGKIKYADVKQPRNGGQTSFGFVEFDDSRDADEAIKERDGYDYDGHKLRVEKSHGGKSTRNSSRERGGSSRRNDTSGRNNKRRSKYRIEVKNLPKSGSWQDLKDHMRQAGDVLYTEVYGDCSGIVEFQHRDDMDWAVRKLHKSKFYSHQNESSYIEVRECCSSSRSRSYSRSISPRKSRHSSYSSDRSRSNTRRSKRHKRSRSSSSRDSRRPRTRYSRSLSKSSKSSVSAKNRSRSRSLDKKRSSSSSSNSRSSTSSNR